MSHSLFFIPYSLTASVATGLKHTAKTKEWADIRACINSPVLSRKLAEVCVCVCVYGLGQ